MRIGFISMQYYDNRKKGTVGSSRIRADWVVENSDGLFEKYKIGEKYDCLIFQKAYWEDMVKNFDGIKIFDICDPDWLDHRPVIEMIRNCDGVTTSTERLAEQIRQFDIGGKPVLCIPDRLDFEWSKPVKPLHEGRAISAVWFGYSNNSHVLDSAVDGLNRRGIKLTVISDKPYHGNDFFIPYDEETINEEIIKHDIVLLPKASSSDYRFQFKSNNKTIQSWALGMPVATNGEELDRFLSADERNKEVELRMKEVHDKWDIKLSVKEYINFINSIKK
jgi:hypothetical protein